MKRANHIKLALLAAMLAGTGNPLAADKVDLGKAEYESNCILCHGRDLRGGAYVDMLKTTPPDLSQLSKTNGGVFPFERVYATIDGRGQGKAHGTREMPIWGRDYQVKAAEYYVDVNYDAEAYIRGRVFALIDYLNRMQAK